MRIVLASSSPRRIEILSQKGYEFSVKPQDIDENLTSYFTQSEIENLLKGEKEKLVMKIAEKKADNYLLAEDEVIISCDTMVYQNGEIFGKPKDIEEAKSMLSKFSASEHEVITGYVVATKNQKIIDFEITKVKFKNLTQEEIKQYINDYKPFDKAGAYGVQDGGLVAEILGDYSNIVGFPEKIYKDINRFVKV